GDLRHRAGLRPARGQGRRGWLRAFLRRLAAGLDPRRRRGARGERRVFGDVRGCPPAHQCASLWRRQSARCARLRKQGETARRNRRLCPRPRSAGAAGDGQSRRDLATREILRPDGESYRDVRPLVRVNISVVAGQGDRQETGSKGYGGREGYARFIETKAWREAADGAIREAMVNLESVPAPAGEMDVVLGAGWPGVMLHEAVGHGLEGDFNRKRTSAFAGLMGQQVAAKGVTVVDDGTMASRRGSLSIDDEGTPTNRTVL